MLVLLFDIDGTLISTGGAGLNALRAAMREEFGVAEPSDVPVSGRTDRGIARDLFRAHELEENEVHWHRFLKAYLRHLADQLPRTRGRVLPGVAPLLDALCGIEHARLGLLTGNVQAGAQLKLRQYGLDRYFAFGGFGDHHADRDGVAAEALHASRDHLPANIEPDRVWVIGDTPMDITCARSISARCLAVATGSFPREALEAYSPDLAVDSLDRLDHLLEVLVG
jgi:phosphoglycolate phosphatase-like HAD superfamily hydrolase